MKAATAQKFDKPTPVTALDVAFGGDMEKLMPAYGDIPDEFKRQGNKWVKWQMKWFYSGLDKPPTPKPGIDARAAMQHLSAIQGSFQPKHEHKMAGVAYLASIWFTAA